MDPTDGLHGGGGGSSDYEYENRTTYVISGKGEKKPKKPTPWETKAKLAEAALVKIINHIGSARECKTIASEALKIIRYEVVDN